MSDSDAGRALRSGAATNNSPTNAAGANNGSKGATKRRKAVPGEEILHRMVAEARYELNIDPYRGMMRYAGNHDDESTARSAKVNILSPWESSCRWNIDSTTTTTDENDTVEESEGATLVQMVCQSRCPCLTIWTDQLMQKRKSKKRKKGATEQQPARPIIGGRPPDKDTERCRCDYNPFCLGSLGGAIDDVWQRRLQTLVLSGENSTTTISGNDSPRAPSPPNGDPEVIEIQESGSEDSSGLVILRPTLLADPSLDENKTLYTHRTWARLRTLRQSTHVETKRIRSYLNATLQSLTSLVSIDTCMERIETWHKELLFENPLLKAESKEGHTRLAVPPGIENLGATCYLNTQLQCLAQITVFLNGIFSWRTPHENTEDKVNEVLSIFQRIMADLHAGPRRTITTVEFSNALGIDHYEQQDPNEFSRLFFDLMHTAFQKEVSNKPGGLPELLPDLFQGMIKNQIICKKCGNNSERKEAFMDLNLPIVKKSEEDKVVKKTGQLSILECLGNEDATDVQYLFNSYCQDETLEGDNQYHCEVCGCKQDAQRRVRFEKVPPLLNIQLSRYTYDMKTFAKKKVSEKVLLPLEMCVSSEAQGADSSTEHRYVLCAVMIHKGKSAYSGHYIAQAMDWTTGSWFQFNDTHVKLLKDGPECSVDPSSQQTGNSKKAPTGSQDAYNLYYVEETFLAQSIVEKIKSLASTECLPQIVDEKAAERISVFADLRDLCVKDREAADRLKKRRNGVLNDLFGADRPLELLSDSMDPPPVWVPGDFLRRFFSCSDSFGDDLAQDIVEDVIKASDSLCEHGQAGIHPRVARRGKLLPRVMYETVIGSLMEERELLLAGQVQNAEERQDGFVISPSESMYCQQCVDDFQLNVRPKIELLEDYLFLFDALDTKSDDVPVDYEAGTAFHCKEDMSVYVVTRKFCTALRDHIKQIMKKVAAVDAESFPVDDKLLPLFENIAEGIEAMDMKDLEIPENSNVDKFVNSSVTCPHGCCTRISKQSVRFVPWKVWTTIQKLFPQAAEHSIARRCSDDPTTEGLIEGCSQCESEGTLVNNLARQISLVAKSCRTIREIDSDHILVNDDERETLFAVHKRDLKALKRFGREFSKFNPKSEPEVIRQQVLGCFQPEDALLNFTDDKTALESLSEVDRRTVQLVSKLIRRLECPRHHLPISGVLLDASKGSKPHLSQDFCLLDAESYRQYTLLLCAIARILILSEDKLDIIDVVDDDGKVQHDDLKDLCKKEEMKVWHPKLVFTPPSDKAVILALEGMSTPVMFLSDMCCNKGCLSEFEKIYSPVPKQNGTTKASTGATADDAILIDDVQVIEDDTLASASKFPLTVFEAEATASNDSIMDALAQYTTISTGQEKENAGTGLRRSSRRRKPRIGVLTCEETVQADMQNNIAALRLLMLESLREGTNFHPNHRLLLVVSPVDTRAEAVVNDQEKSMAAQIVELNFGYNQSSLTELCDNALGGDLSLLLPKDSLIIVRQPIVDESAMDFEGDSLMDHLISLSNAGTASPNGKKRKARVVERGFTGTLLSAGVSAATSNSKKPRSDDGNEDENNGTNKQTSPLSSDPSNCRAIVLVDPDPAPPAKYKVHLIDDNPSKENSPVRPASPDEVEIHDDTTTDKEGGDYQEEDMAHFDDEILTESVRDLLKERPDVDRGKASELYSSSLWACQENHSIKDIDKLVEIAYVKYLDLTLEN